MIATNSLISDRGTACRLAAALLAATLLLGATPALAGWLDRGVGVAGAGNALKETLAENADRFGEMVSAFIEGDDETVSELVGEVAKTPGKLIKRAFPVLEAPQAIADRLTSAKQKVERFVGGVGETLTDARAALAIDRDERNTDWAGALLDDDAPLPALAESVFTAPGQESPAEVLAARGTKVNRQPGEAGNTATDPWDFERWVNANQTARPHCYGVVDLDTLPADCFSAANPGQPAVEPETERVEASTAGDSASEYAAALADVLGDDPTAAASDDYLAALGVLEEKEAEQQRRLEAEERERQAKLEREERERQARLEREEQQQARRKAEARERRARRAEEERRQREYDLAEQRQQAEYRRHALQNLNESLRGFADQVNRTYGGSNATGGGGTTGIQSRDFDYCRLTPGVQSSPDYCSVPCGPAGRAKC